MVVFGKGSETEHAVVTGGSSGIGHAIIGRLRRYSVVVHDFSRRTTGIDVTDEARVAEAYDALPCVPRYLAACAGIIDPVLPFPTTPVRNWRNVIDVNLTGTYIVAREHARRLIKEGMTGTIALFGSPSGRRPSLQNLAYGVSKAAVLALGTGLARGLEEHGIRVYTICPSHVDTPMMRSRGFDLDGVDMLSPGEVAAEVVRLLVSKNDFLDGQPLYMSRMVTAKQQ